MEAGLPMDKGSIGFKKSYRGNLASGRGHGFLLSAVSNPDTPLPEFLDFFCFLGTVIRKPIRILRGSKRPSGST